MIPCEHFEEKKNTFLNKKEVFLTSSERECKVVTLLPEPFTWGCQNRILRVLRNILKQKILFRNFSIIETNSYIRQINFSFLSEKVQRSCQNSTLSFYSKNWKQNKFLERIFFFHNFCFSKKSFRLSARINSYGCQLCNHFCILGKMFLATFWSFFGGVVKTAFFASLETVYTVYIFLKILSVSNYLRTLIEKNRLFAGKTDSTCPLERCEGRNLFWNLFNFWNIFVPWEKNF